ncbi:MAG TPA: IclR family transcriptional regulator [Halanaerobiales bacterium]|nr:IclR family transcriptional regulator [Halanaerobiales bacterium]
MKSVAKALSIIDYINKNDSATLKKISNDIGIPKSTALGILKTLEQFEYINKLEDKEYELGIYLFELGNNVRKKINLDVIAKPYLEKLADKLGETINLAILDNNEVLLLDKYKPDYGFQIGAQIGTRLKPHCIAVGKVLISHLEEEELDLLIEKNGLPRMTTNTIIDKDKLKSHLKQVFKEGFAEDNGELMENMRCIAAPIYNHKGENIAAISISSLDSKLRGEVFDESKKLLLDYSKKISKNLGYNE